MQKNYIVVGGSKGIGKATTEKLLAAGYHVHVIARSTPDFGGNVTAYICDVLTDDLPKIEGGISGLIYCPGSINLKPFKSLKAKDFEEDYAINVLGAVKALQAYEKQLKATQDAAVVLFSTVAVQTGMSFHTSIAAAKGAVEGLVRSLAAEWSPKVRVNGIAPSIIQTDLAARLLRNDKQIEAAEGRHPLARIGQAEDAAALATFLVEPTAGWITGQIIGLDGGMSAIKKL